MRALLIAAMLVVATGCGGSEPSKAAPSSDPSTSAAEVPLVTACGQVAAALPKGTGTYDEAAMKAFFDRLMALNNGGGPDVRAALRPLAQPTLDLASQVTAARHAAFLDALSGLAASCRTAGSTAFD